MRIEYIAFRELDGDLPKEAIEYAKEGLRYKILEDNGLNEELLKQVDELITYFQPKYDYASSLLSSRVRNYIASFLGKKDFILMGIKAYEEIITILKYKKEALEFKLKRAKENIK